MSRNGITPIAEVGRVRLARRGGLAPAAGWVLLCGGVVLAVCGVLLAGCGQKGALYLPDRNATVVTRTAPTESSQSQRSQSRSSGSSQSSSASQSSGSSRSSGASQSSSGSQSATPGSPPR